MKTVLILGHKGMLGNAVLSYFTQENKYTVLITSERFGSEAFNNTLKESAADVIVNCIGLIPQKKPAPEEYTKINIELPIFLETLGKNVILPSTDCEFSGTISPPLKYKKDAPRDAEDEYGKSKAHVSKLIEDSFENTKVIRTSVIGHELTTHLSLLDWFLNSTTQVNGYTNHYWNGITTLQWAKVCEELIDNWDNHPQINQYGTDEIASKYDVLNTIKDVYGSDVAISPFETTPTVNKCLETDAVMPTLKEQLVELKKFYGK